MCSIKCRAAICPTAVAFWSAAANPGKGLSKKTSTTGFPVFASIFAMRAFMTRAMKPSNDAVLSVLSSSGNSIILRDQSFRLSAKSMMPRQRRLP